MPTPQPDPRMAQWQARFDMVQRALSEPRRPGETPEQFNTRRAAAYNALRQIQTARPTGQSVDGNMPQGQPQQQQPAQGGGGMLDGLYGYIQHFMPRQ